MNEADGAAMGDRDRWIAAGLVEPDDPAADDLVDVLARYAAAGVDPLEPGLVEDRAEMLSALNRRLFNPGPRRSASMVRDELGLDAEQFGRLVDAMGFDAGEGFTELDVEAFSMFSLASGMFSELELVRFTRVLGALMDRLAAATTSLFQIDVAAEMVEAGADELDFARTNLESAAMVGAIFTPLEAMFRHRLEVSGRHNDLARAEVSGSRQTVLLTIGFVDVVDSTGLADALTPDELASVMLDFEERAYRVAGRQDGRIVKLIGDEVMFVTVDAVAGAAMIGDLMAEFAEAALIPRGGLTRGEVVSRGGDVHGRAVNLAARLVDQAVPGEVLVDDAVAAALGAARTETAGRRMLRGFAEPVRVHTLVEASTPGSESIGC